MLTTALLAAFSAAASATKPPHLILLVLDDVGWADTTYRNGTFPTPNIDGLMRGGVVLDKYYVQPACSPTRSAFMSGRYPFHTGMQHRLTLIPGTGAHLPMDTPTVAELIKQAGYEAHAVGKWHLGYSAWDHTPVGRGFESWTGYLQGQIDYYTHIFEADGFFKGLDFWDNTTGVFQPAWSASGTYTMPHYTARVEAILDGLAEDKALFLYYAHQEIHIPIEYPPEDKFAQMCQHLPKNYPSDTMNRQALCAMMADLDEEVGKFADLLKKKNMWDNSLIFVTTDNGGMVEYQPEFPASVSSNWPLRGSKMTVFEGGVRGTAWIMGGFVPEKLRGTTFSGLMHAVDVAPTLLVRAGLGMQKQWDGKDMWGTMLGEEPEEVDREIPLNVYDYGKNLSALIKGDMKIIVGKVGVEAGYWTSDASYQHIPSPENATIKLFNLTADPNEQHNIATDFPDITSSMVDRLENFYGNILHGYRPPQLNIMNPDSLPTFHNGTWAPWRKD